MGAATASSPCLTSSVIEDLSGVATAQLERWAYRRAESPDEHARARLAAAELQRRAAIEQERNARADAERAAAAASVTASTSAAQPIAEGEVDGRESDPADSMADDERRHQHRMLSTARAGLIAAALALAGAVFAFSQPNPDPMAIFDSPETPADVEWAAWLAFSPVTTFTAGPRAFSDEDGRVGIAARVSTLPDGSSTEWDAYCLFIASSLGDGSQSITGDCVDPHEFADSGVSVMAGASRSADGYDMASWGPTGAPSIQENVPLDDLQFEESLMRVLANPFFEFAPPLVSLPLDDTLGEVLMGPRVVYGAPSINGLAPDVAVSLRGTAESDREPEVCMTVSHPEARSAGACNPLSVARQVGVDVPLLIAGAQWFVSITAEGTITAREPESAPSGD